MKTYTTEEFMSEFGNAQVQLTSYYKFVFQYSGLYKGKRLFVKVGGSSDDIYRFEPTINAPTPIEELIESGLVSYVSISENVQQIGEYKGPNY